MTETSRTASTKTGRRTPKKKTSAKKKTASMTPRTKAASKKATAAKAPARKTATKKKAGTRKTAPRKKAARPAIERSVTLEERHRMVSEAAFYKAASRGFVGGDSERDWFEAEAEIDAMLLGRAED